ncbi:MAG: GTP-binding protein, partial [Verrucomicrobiota bacterium]
ARIVKLPFGLPELGEILAGPAAEAELRVTAETDAEQEPHLHHAYQSVTWRFPVPVERSKFEAFLSGLDPRQVVRAKGFVRFVRQPEKLFIFQSVFGHHFIEEFPARPHPEAVAVLIGPHLDAAKVHAQLRALVFAAQPAGLKLG